MEGVDSLTETDSELIRVFLIIIYGLILKDLSLDCFHFQSSKWGQFDCGGHDIHSILSSFFALSLVVENYLNFKVTTHDAYD